MFKHLNNVCMNYYEHMKFSLYLSKEFLKASFFAFIHAIYPDIYVTYSSDTLLKLSYEIKNIGCK